MDFLKVKPEKIPNGLKEINQWVIWKAEEREGKTTKVPCNAKSLNMAKSNGPETWTDFETAYSAYRGNGFDGIGIVLSKDDSLCGWDFDHCRDLKTGETDPAIKEYIKSLNGYTEVSPSGTGYRVILNATLPPTGRKKGQVEVYENGRYLTITGHVLEGMPKTIEDRQDETTSLHKKIFIPKEKPKKSRPILNDNELLQKAFNSANGDKIARLYTGDFSDYPSQSEADAALCSHLSFWLNRDANRIDAAFKQSGLYREKWDKKHFSDGRTYGEATIQRAIEKTTESYTPQKNKPCLKPARIKEHKNSEFPSSVLTGAAGYVADVFGDIIEAPVEFIFMSYLTCLGAAVARNLQIASALKTQPRMYTVLLGESATERKSTTLNIIIDLFKSVLDRRYSVCWGLGSAEGLRKVLKNNDEQTKSGTLLTFDELKAFVSKCGIDNSVLLPIVNTLFEANLYETHTKKESVKIEDAFLSILAATTIPTYERIYTKAFLDIGFTNRVFLVPGTASKKYAIPKKVPESEQVAMEQDIVKILKHVGTGLELDLTPEAYNLYDKWYQNLETSIHAKRLETYSLRLMLLLAINNLKTVIDIETTQGAIDLCNWQLEVRKLHDPIDADSIFAKMEELIRRHLSKGALKDRELKQKVNANRVGIWVFDSSIKNLQKAKEIAWNRTTKKWFLVES